jgi:nucleoside-diphosphate-sugar epimerase
MIKNGIVPIVGDGENLRSLTYVDSLSQAVLQAAGSSVANGQTYWVADIRPYSMNEIVDTIERLMETEFGIRVAHKRMRLPTPVGALAHLGDQMLQKLGFYDSRIHVLSQMDKTIACSVEKAQRELGYAPTVEIEEGMRRSLAWLVTQRIAV